MYRCSLESPFLADCVRKVTSILENTVVIVKRRINFYITLSLSVNDKVQDLVSLYPELERAHVE